MQRYLADACADPSERDFLQPRDKIRLMILLLDENTTGSCIIHVCSSGMGDAAWINMAMNCPRHCLPGMVAGHILT